MQPNDTKYHDIQKELIETIRNDRIKQNIIKSGNLKNEREKWNFIFEARNSRRTCSVIPSLKNASGDCVSEPRKKPNLLNYRFSKLGDYLGDSKNFTDFLDDLEFTNIRTFRFQPINLFKCKTFLKEINCRKPLGPCDVPAWALKDCLNIIAEPLTFLINAFLAADNFPSHLKCAHVVPMYKNGDTEDPSNYGPISITSALSKIFEKVMKDQIDDYLEKNQLLSPIQFGFHRGFSTTDALLYATEKIRLNLDNKNGGIGSIDLSKAFDSISHNLLLAKLKSFNFDTSAINMIES